MSNFDFVERTMCIGGTGNEVPTLQFYKKGFSLSGNGATPSWRDIILSGNTALTLVNSKANGLNYVKLFGKSLLSSAPAEIDVTPRTTETPTGNYTVGTTSISSEYSGAGGNYLRYAFDGNNSTQFVQSLANPNIFLQDTQGFNFDTIMVRPGGGSYGSNFKYFALDYMSPTGWTNIATTTTLVDEWATLSGIGDTIRSLPANTKLRLHIDMYNTSEWGGFAEVKMILKRNSVVPTPDTPMDIVCNNGVLKYNSNIVDNTITGQGTFVNPSSQATRIYKYFGKLQPGNYTLSITGGFQFIAQYRDVDPPAADMTYGNIGTWATSGTYTLDNPDYFYGIAIRYPYNSNITPSDFNGTIALKPQFIYADGTVETVQVTGNNLFNKDDSTNWGGWYPSGGVIAQSANSNRTAVIRCQPNTTYYFKHCTYMGGLRAFCIETETWDLGTPVASSGGAARDDANVVYSFTTTANAKWLFALFGRNDANVTATFEEQASDYILSTEVLTSDTPYEPYFNGGTATAEMLLAVGDYQDEQSVIDGGVTRNVGIKVFDGTENWSTGTASNPNRYTLAAAFNDLADLIDNNIGYSNCYTVISKSANIQSSLQNNECGWNKTKVFCVRDDRIATLAQWTQFLTDQYNAGTPVIVVYPTSSPTTESVTPQPLNIQAGTNIITAEGSIEDLELEVSYKATV